MAIEKRYKYNLDVVKSNNDTNVNYLDITLTNNGISIDLSHTTFTARAVGYAL
mgnify:CR=1 FL=1